MAKSIKFTPLAQKNIDETGVDWAEDFRDLIIKKTSAPYLLKMCLIGADEDRKQGWIEYVDTLEAARKEIINEILESFGLEPEGP